MPAVAIKANATLCGSGTIVIEADLYDPAPDGGAAREATAANLSFYRHVQRLGLAVDTIVPIHGQPVPWSEFLAVVQAARND